MAPGCGSCARPRFNLILEDVLPDVKVVVARIGELTKPEGPGGAFGLLHVETNRFFIKPTIVCSPTAGKEQKYLQYCPEKALRLRRMYLEHGHMLSAQSRDPDAEQYGGAVCDGIYIWSFSGLPEFGDETAMLLSAQRAGQMTWGTAEHLARLSGNDVLKNEMFFDPFWENRRSRRQRRR